MKITSVVLRCALVVVTAAFAAATLQAQVHPVPRIVEKNGRFALFVDDAPFLIMGIEDLTMGDWPPRPAIWPALEYMHVNTVEIAVYWQDFEPQPGKYDYAVIDRLLEAARQHNVRLLPLWFGSYKNGHPHYMPDWMKLDPVRYPHALDKKGQAVDSPSPFATASLDLDKRAFSALLAHLKEVDPQRTVIMVQVENETGNWGCVRDFSPAAQKYFTAPVPPEVLKAMHVGATPPSPSWEQAFGPNADEYFNAWAVARYVGQVAGAGKAVYPLPMVANVALRDPLHPGP
ncbi:MAG: beta-galactosidase, partial [Bryobacteraceae bacterium]